MFALLALTCGVGVPPDRPDPYTVLVASLPEGDECGVLVASRKPAPVGFVGVDIPRHAGYYRCWKRDGEPVFVEIDERGTPVPKPVAPAKPAETPGPKGPARPATPGTTARGAAGNNSSSRAGTPAATPTPVSGAVRRGGTDPNCRT